MTGQKILSFPSEDQYQNCVRCGLCLAVCPTYRELLIETASPRGRVALVRKGLEGELDLRSNLFEQMNACFDCLACNEICPVGIRPADLAMELRAVQEELHPRVWKKGLFGGLVPHPGRLELATCPLRLYERLGVRRLVNALGADDMLPTQMRDMEAMLPHLPQRPLRHTLPEVIRARGEPRYRVGFFLGCVQSLMFARQSTASISVLTRNGCIVFTPKDAVCCGMPAEAFGKTDQAREQARQNIAQFENFEIETIVTDCATCGSMLKGYGTLLADDPAWASRATAFSARVQDVSEFLMSIPLEKPRGRIEARVTYHDPCHLRRGQGVWKQPRALLQMIDGVDFFEMPEADWCCGSAGSQLITHHETSLKVLQRKIDHLSSTRADYVASGCPGCQMQLNVGVRRNGMKMEVTHPIVLLDMAYS